MKNERQSLTDSCEMSRRRFLGSAAAVAVAPGVFLYGTANAKPVSSRVRWGMLIDTRKCGDCNECVTACNVENGLPGTTRPTDAQWIRKVQLRDRQTGATQSLPLLCLHCEHPPCVDVCPTGASFRRADGIVLVDKHICIGCRYCMMACPYKARSFIHEPVTDQRPHAPRGKGTVESCTFCVHRVDQGMLPACVEACSRAGRDGMVFGDLNNPESAVSRRLAAVRSEQLRADLRLNTGVRYEGL